MMNNNKKTYTVKNDIAETLIDSIKQGTAPWLKPWKAGEFRPPFNGSSGRSYNGINVLSIADAGLADPRWMTFKQAEENGLSIKKGSKAKKIQFWCWEENQNKKDNNGNPIVDEKGKFIKEKVKLATPKVSVHAVFNGSQIVEMPELEPRQVDWDPIKKAEELIKNSAAKIIHDQRDRAYYSPSEDVIHMPEKANFDNAENYYSTLLHELGHWTGHKDRLNREFGAKGTDEYAKEELRAEIFAFTATSEIGISHDPSQYASYVESYLKILENDNNEIFRAAKDAENICSHLGIERINEIKLEGKPVKAKVTSKEKSKGSKR